MSSTPESEYDNWFNTERGTELEEDDMPDFDDMSSNDWE